MNIIVNNQKWNEGKKDLNVTYQNGILTVHAPHFKNKKETAELKRILKTWVPIMKRVWKNLGYP